MTWFKIDDGWARHPKVRRAGKDGRALWIVSGVESAKNRTDGRIDPLMLSDAGHLCDVTGNKLTRSAATLVEVDLWHISGHRCPRCPRLTDDEFYFHDWTDWQPNKAELENPVAKSRLARKRALYRDRELLGLIHERDGSHCRYCAVRVNFGDRRTGQGGTYDHVDPDGENSLENVVVACRTCNGRKRDRTPGEAGMPLLVIRSASDPVQVQNESGSDPDQVLASETGRIGSASNSDLMTGGLRAVAGSGPGSDSAAPRHEASAS